MTTPLSGANGWSVEDPNGFAEKPTHFLATKNGRRITITYKPLTVAVETKSSRHSPFGWYNILLDGKTMSLARSVAQARKKIESLMQNS